jgi:uncharacterized protein (TIGR02996 family)
MNAEQQALLLTILEHPDDDAPRLVYADWLEERGDSDQTARAYFIRRQIALSAIDPAELSGEALDEQRRLLDLAQRRWVPAWLRGRASWSRGFIQGVYSSVADWVKHHEELVAEHPIRRVALHGEVRPEDMPVIAETATLCKLDLSACTFAAAIHLAAMAATRGFAGYLLQGIYLLGRAWPRWLRPRNGH